MTILHTTDDNTSRVVQLSLDAGNSYSSDVTLTIARLSANYVNLARLKETHERDDEGHFEDPERIALTSEEADALVEAWTAFKREQNERKIAEEVRKATLFSDACILAATFKTNLDDLDITIKADLGDYYTDYYNVKVAVFNLHRHVHVDRLLTAVKEIADEIEHIIVRFENMTAGHRERLSAESLAEQQAQIAAWRTIRPLPVAEPEQVAEQGVTPEDIDVAESMGREQISDVY